MDRRCLRRDVRRSYPATGEVIAHVSEGAQSDVDAAIAATRRAFDGGKWPTFSASRHGKVLFKMAQLIAERTDELARLEVRDNGKTIATAKGEIGAIVEVFEFYGGAATKNYGDTIPGMSSSFSISTTRESAGVVGAIIPWISRRSWPHGKLRRHLRRAARSFSSRRRRRRLRRSNSPRSRWKPVCLRAFSTS